MTKIPAILGISGTSLTIEEKEFFKHKDIYGFILFRRNIESEYQLLRLVEELENINTNSHPKLFIDQEGGRVQRITTPINEYTYPAAGYFSKVYDELGKDIAIQLVENNYKNLMTDLQRFKIISPCAPVADLRIPERNNIIGDRSFGEESSKVVELCQAAINGIEQAGGKAVIKHIPGHGRAKLDSHKELPVVKTSLDELMESDFIVFKELSKILDKESYAMTAHIIYEAIDKDLPATLSNKVINFIRNEIGFKGLLITDDICMNALHQNISTKILEYEGDQRENYKDDIYNSIEYISQLGMIAHRAFDAGCDLILHCSGNLAEIRAVVYALEFPIQEV